MDTFFHASRAAWTTHANKLPSHLHGRWKHGLGHRGKVVWTTVHRADSTSSRKIGRVVEYIGLPSVLQHDYSVRTGKGEGGGDTIPVLTSLEGGGAPLPFSRRAGKPIFPSRRGERWGFRELRAGSGDWGSKARRKISVEACILICSIRNEQANQPRRAGQLSKSCLGPAYFFFRLQPLPARSRG